MIPKRSCALYILVLLCTLSMSYAAPSATLSDQASLDQPSLIPSAPGLPVKSYALIDPNTQQIIAQKNGDKYLDIASLTKLMSLYIIDDALQAQQIHLDDRVKISHKAWHIEGSRMFLKEGEYVPVESLIKGIIVTSGNDATIALAEHLAGNEATFIQLMNQTSKALKMNNSVFETATGLPTVNSHSSAVDMAILSAALIKRFPEYYGYYKQKWLTHNKVKQPNRNRLLWSDQSVDGLKTGHTKDAGYCLVTSAKRHGTRLIAVIIGAKSDYDRFAAAETLLNYGFRYFQSQLILKKNSILKHAHVWKGQKTDLPLGIQNDLYVTVTPNQSKHLNVAIHIQPNISAPIHKNQAYGSITVVDQNNILATRPLVALDNILPASGLMQTLSSIKMKLHHLFSHQPTTTVLTLQS